MDEVLILSGYAATTIVAVILCRAAWHKVTAFLEAVGFARDYGLLPQGWTAPAVRMLAATEILAVILLVLPATRLWGGLLSAVLLVGYGLAMAAALRAGRSEIECGCGGPPQVVSTITLARNAVLALLALWAGLAPSAPVSGVAAAAAILAGMTLILVLVVAETLDANRAMMARAGRAHAKELFR